MSHKFLIAALLLAGTTAFAQNNTPAHPPAGHRQVALCDNCGTVQQVKLEKRKGEGGAVGIVGGAVVGGLLGNQIGGGTGRSLATVGGAVAGGYAGNEVQKHATAKNVWVTRVKMKDGSIRSFEQQAQPGWAVGNRVKVHQNTLTRF